MTKPTPTRVLIIAGEASGDHHAADLINALQKQYPNQHWQFTGIGGPNMRKAGTNLLMDANELSVVGLIEILLKGRALLKAKRLIKKQLYATPPPHAVILVDYPGFNLHIAKLAKRANLRVIYYISPQVWAWRKSRLQFIKKWVDHMIVILPFEKSLYDKASIPATFVGHPLTTQAICPLTSAQAREFIGVKTKEGGSHKANSPLVALMPGSRLQEIQRLLPEMLKAAVQLQTQLPSVQFCLPIAPNLPQTLIEGYLKAYPALPITLTRETYPAIKAADLVIVASGTATLEVGLLETPMVIVYKLSWLSYFIAKHMVYLSEISLCNIILGKRLCPELLQQHACALTIANEAFNLLTNSRQRAHTIAALQTLKSCLHLPNNAAENAAKVVLKCLEQK